MQANDDRAFSVAELLVSVTLLVIVLGSVYAMTGAIRAGGRVMDRQSTVARDISTPLHSMDKTVSQNKAIENAGTFISDGYTLSVRSPLDRVTRTFTRHIYRAETDGRITETIYRQHVDAASPTLVRTAVWSRKNANREKGPMFTYLGPDGSTIAATQATSVIIKIWAKSDGTYLEGQRQVFFRNR